MIGGWHIVPFSSNNAFLSALNSSCENGSPLLMYFKYILNSSSNICIGLFIFDCVTKNSV